MSLHHAWRRMQLAMLCCALAAGVPGCGLQVSKRAEIDTPPPHPLADPRVLDTPRQPQMDPSSSRLHEICGALLLYCALNRTMPKSLSELQSVQDLDVQLDTTSPQSHEPYVYEPQGLQAPGRTRRIILYDPAVSSNGKRWCVFAEGPRPGQAQSLQVESVPASVFREYVPPGK